MECESREARVGYMGGVGGGWGVLEGYVGIAMESERLEENR
jgi:hypothetical protein